MKKALLAMGLVGFAGAAQSYESKLFSQVKQLNIPRETGVKITVYNPVGARERELFSGRLSAGEHLFELPGLGRGVHIAVAETGLGIKSVRIIR